MLPLDSLRICLLLLLSLCAAASGQSTTESTASTESAEQSRCSSNSSSFPTQAPVDALTYSYGGLEGFYTIATGIADGLHGKLKQELIQKFADVIKGDSNDISGLVSDALKNQAGFIIFVIIGLIFIIFFPLVGCCYCCCRCYCSKCGAKRYQKEDASTGYLIALLVILIISFAFLLTGTIIYGKSVTNGQDAVDDLAQDAIKLGGDFGRFATSTANQMIEAASDFINCTVDGVNNEIHTAAEDAIKIFTSLTGLDSLKDLIQAGNAVSGQFQSIISATGDAQPITDSFNSSFNSFVNEVNAIYHNATSAASAILELGKINSYIVGLPFAIQMANSSLNDFLTQSDITRTVNDANSRVDDARKQVNDSLSHITDQVNSAKVDVEKVISELRNLTNTANDYIDNVTTSVQDAHKSYNDFDAKNAIVAGVTVIVVLPCAVALILIASGLACGVAGYRGERFPPQRTGFSHAAGYVSIATCIFLFCVGGFLMFLSTVLFSAGYALQFGCASVFYDDTYQVVEFANQYIPSITNPIDGTAVNISIKEAIQGCEKGDTVYAVGHGDQIFNVTQILEKMQFNASSIDVHVNTNLNFTLSQNEINEINLLETSLRTAQNISSRVQLSSPPTKNTVQYLTEVQTFLTQQGSTLADNATTLINQANSVNTAVDKVKDQVDQMNYNITQVLGYIDYLLTNRTDVEAAIGKVQEFATKLFNDLTKIASDSLYQLQDNLRNKIANCRPLYDTWQNVGTLVCKKLGHPLQGVWAAIGLAVIFFIPLIITLTLISKYMYRMDFQYYSMVTGGSISNGQRLDRIAPEVISVPPRSFLSEEPDSPVKKMLDDQSDEFKFEPNGDYGSRSAGQLGSPRPNSSGATENAVSWNL